MHVLYSKKGLMKQITAVSHCCKCIYYLFTLNMLKWADKKKTWNCFLFDVGNLKKK